MNKKIKHKFILGIEYKQCSECNRWKSLNYFDKNVRLNKEQFVCKSCKKQFKLKKIKKSFDDLANMLNKVKDVIDDEDLTSTFFCSFMVFDYDYGRCECLDGTYWIKGPKQAIITQLECIVEEIKNREENYLT